MPTTATVAPRRAYTGADIASGLRALADLIETKPWIAAGVRLPTVPQHFTIGLTERRDVEALAVVFDDTVHEAEQDSATYVSTSGQLDGLRVSAYAVIDHASATSGIAEEPDRGECFVCGPDQEADSDGQCAGCGRRLNMSPDLRSDPNWWAA
ncbi:hypothetical protein [Microbacterium enclense]|uniref:Uncharacterized protein n=1 Tax=Microbacterium enclense TaxID=993073 RepID=A0A1G6NSI4_9MICO|nr:hypothetical protein [Microbacterium enclense]KSU52861.1 hypothetical protein AS029_12695 [Microbacterium enclense]SDC70145.1 hypothetical protein SAMN05216418_2818 [Microbacterium enclense]